VSKFTVIIFLALFGMSSLLAACNSLPVPPPIDPAPITTTVTPDQDGGEIIQPILPTPTQVRETRLLKVCTGSEPDSLFPYGSISASTRSILQALYDGPLDYNGFSLAPVILEQIPNLENGEAFFEPLQVSAGDIIVDNSGNIGKLRQGTIYRPSGCKSPECALTFTGDGPVQIDSLVVRFRLLPGLKWSDGSAMTARDSEYAYHVAQSVYPAHRPEYVRITLSYRSMNDTTIEWRGLPGSQPPWYAETFFSPLPEHAWNGIPALELAASEVASRNPLGWGAYALEDWTAGESVLLAKNPHYFRADQELPYFDRLIFRFTDSAEEALQALRSGDCDLADEASLRNIGFAELQEMQSETSLSVYTTPGAGWEQILFGIDPLSEEQPAFFRSEQVRQAIAACIDREKIIDELYPGLTLVPHSLLLPDHPLYNHDVSHHPYDPEGASSLLTASGWIDHDNHPGTPRLAQGVPGVQDGTPFEFTYLVSDEAERERSASLVAAYLAECGIQANLSFEDPSRVYAGGPEGAVFGRQFDAVQLAWRAYSELPCTLYSSNEIPGPDAQASKGWGGANASGFSDQDFDQACNTSLSTLRNEPAFTNAYQQLQQVFSEQLPALPLYMHLRVAAARPDLCGLQLDPSNPSILWNLEELDYGDDCQP
jgi:peptide/nickel transport system substrate-binding protein